jgi:hypothetical protein
LFFSLESKITFEKESRLDKSDLVRKFLQGINCGQHPLNISHVNLIRLLEFREQVEKDKLDAKTKTAYNEEISIG